MYRDQEIKVPNGWKLAVERVTCKDRGYWSKTGIHEMESVEELQVIGNDDI